MIGKNLLQNISESANPVFIKEMRQYFQNRRMVFFIGVMLIAQFVFTLFFSLLSSDTPVSSDSTNGVTFFLLIICIGAVLAILICAIGSEFRFSEERSDKELNYTMLTTLKPTSVILGKLEGALVMLLCIFSLLLPFLTAAYFMRGISVASLLLVLILLPPMLMCSLFGILAGSFGKRAISILYLLGMLGFILSFLPTWFFLAKEVMGNAVATGVLWIGIAIEYGLFLLSGTLVFLLSAAVIAPPKSNRFLPTKIYVFCVPFITFAVLLAIVPFGLPKEAFFIFEFLFDAGAVFFMLAISLFEPPAAGIRVYMKCPRNFPGRVLHFLFSSSFPGSIFLAILLMLIPFVIWPFMHFPRSGHSALMGLSCVFLTILSYTILAILLSWKTRLKLKPWGLALIFHFGFSFLIRFLSGIAALAGLTDFPEWVQGVIMLFSPFYTLSVLITSSDPETPLMFGLAFAAAISCVLLALIVPTFFRSFKLHHRPSELEAVKTPTPEMLRK